MILQEMSASTLAQESTTIAQNIALIESSNSHNLNPGDIELLHSLGEKMLGLPVRPGGSEGDD